MAKSFKELGKKAENLMEQGREADQNVQTCQARVSAASSRVAAARSQLAAASETDEEGKPRGDVSQAKAQLAVAEGQLAASQRALAAAKGTAGRVRQEKNTHVREIDRHNRVERSNLEKLKQIRASAFGESTAALAEGIAQRLNEAEDAKAELLRSMGLEASPDYVTVGAGGGTAPIWLGGGSVLRDVFGGPEQSPGGLGGPVAAPVGGGLGPGVNPGGGAPPGGNDPPFGGGNGGPPFPPEDEEAHKVRRMPKQEILDRGHSYIDGILDAYEDNLLNRGVPAGDALDGYLRKLRVEYQQVLAEDARNGTFQLADLPEPDYDAVAAELKAKDLQDTENRLKNTFGASVVQLGGMDARVAHDLGDAVSDAKKDFPELKISYFGSCQSQAASVRSELTAYFEKRLLAKHPNGWTAAEYQRVVTDNVDILMKNTGLENIGGAFAWSWPVDPSAGKLSQYSGVAVNLDYASDYQKFRKEKIREVESRHKPIGCNTPRATMDHELGHEIDRLVGAAQDPKIISLYQKMLKDGNAWDVLSGYSETNVKEFIAEGYSEYRNNPHPRPLAKQIYDRLIELRNIKQGGTNP